MLRLTFISITLALFIGSMSAQVENLDLRFTPHDIGRLTAMPLLQSGQNQPDQLQDLGGATSTPLSSNYTLDSTRIELYDQSTNAVHTRRRTLNTPVDDSTTNIVFRSWGLEPYNPENFERIVVQTSTGIRTEQFTTNIITGTNTKSSDILVEIDPVGHQRRTTSTYYDATGAITSTTYQLLDTTIYSSGSTKIETFDTDASFTPTAFVSRVYNSPDAEQRELHFIFQFRDYTGTSPFDSVELANTTWSYVDGQGDDYTYMATSLGFNGSPTTERIGSYSFTPTSIVHTFSQSDQGATTPSFSETITSALDNDGNVTSVTNSLTQNGNTTTRNRNSTYIPGTDLVTAIDFYEGSPAALIRSERRFYSQEISGVRDAIRTSACKLQAGNVGAQSFSAANASFSGTYQLLDVQGRVLQTSSRTEGQSLNLTVPDASGLYYLLGQSATERCVTKLMK
ncbi:MAG: hypothetical protein AB8F78_12410 [Saprospiraceae bacterium]